jgi:hypothetical protein
LDGWDDDDAAPLPELHDHDDDEDGSRSGTGGELNDDWDSQDVERSRHV